jgi:hypothetical protein
MLSELLKLFNPQPGAPAEAAKFFFPFFGIFFSLALIASTVLRRRGHKILRKLTKSPLARIRWASLIGIFFTFMRLEDIRYLAMPLWILLTILWIFGEIIYALWLGIKIFPARRTQSEAQREEEKYLP